MTIWLKKAFGLLWGSCPQQHFWMCKNSWPLSRPLCGPFRKWRAPQEEIPSEVSNCWIIYLFLGLLMHVMMHLRSCFSYECVDWDKNKMKIKISKNIEWKQMVDSYTMCECPLVCVRATKIMEVTRLLHTRGDIENMSHIKLRQLENDSL